MKLQEKKGSLLLEASLIYPLIFLTMIAVICFVICMYMASVTKAGIDIELKEKNLSDKKIGAMELANSKKMAKDKYSEQVFMQGTAISKESVNGESVLKGTKEKEYRSYGISLLSMNRGHFARIYDLDEIRYIRKLDMVVK
ncbi:MAG: hypothetical protein ACTTH0_04275 [Eubacteriales bacterium]